MIKVICGGKGTGKTKTLVNMANDFAGKKSGDTVFIDSSSQLMYDLKHEVRFTDMSDFPVEEASEFLGFICGMISEDYDIEAAFIDGLDDIVKKDVNLLKDFFEKLEQISTKFKIDFYIGVNRDTEKIPEFIRELV